MYNHWLLNAWLLSTRYAIQVKVAEEETKTMYRYLFVPLCRHAKKPALESQIERNGLPERLARGKKRLPDSDALCMISACVNTGIKHSKQHLFGLHVFQERSGREDKVANFCQSKHRWNV